MKKSIPFVGRREKEEGKQKQKQKLHPLLSLYLLVLVPDPVVSQVF